MNIKIKPIIRTDKPAKTNGLFPIYFCVVVGKIQIKTPTKYEVSQKYWDKKQGEVLKGWKNYEEINMVLKKKCSDFDRWVIQNELTGVAVSRETVKDYFSGKKTNIQKSFFDFYSEQVKLWKNKLSVNTIKSYDGTYRALKEFRKQIEFSQLDLTFVEEFDTFLKTVRKNTGGGEFNRHKNLKTVIIAAIRKGLMTKNPYQYFPIKHENPERMFLTPDEVRKFELADLSDKGKCCKIVRDAFLFSCYTGLRYSDVFALKWEQKKDDFLILQMKKTSKMIEVPLMGKALELLKNVWQNNENPPKNSDFIFNLPSNQKTNKNIQMIGKLAKIEKHIIFHMGRHTFASNLVESGVHLIDIKELLGHQDIKQTMIYAKTNRSSLLRSIDKLQNVYTNV